MIHVRDRVQLAEAQVVGAAFGDDCVDLDVEEFGQKGNVAIENLVLKTDGVRGDDDRFVRLAGVEERGHKIGERLADAGRRFNAEVFAVVEGVRDGVRHVDLLLPRLVFKGEIIRGIGVPQGGVGPEKGFSLFFYHAETLREYGLCGLWKMTGGDNDGLRIISCLSRLASGR